MVKIREKFFRWIFLTGDYYKVFMTFLVRLCRFFFALTFFLFLLGVIFYVGFSYSGETSEELKSVFRISFLVLFFSKYIPEILEFKIGKTLTIIFRMIVFLFSTGVLAANFTSAAVVHIIILRPFIGNNAILIAALLMGVSEVSGLFRMVSTVKVPPALVFSISFLFIILIGSGLLILPNAHTGYLSYPDSLFTAVSAVCVTGLTVIDTSAAFTPLGQIIILCLIQVGGLGIMAFTGFFSYVFSSGSSFRDKLLLKEIFSGESLNNLFKLLAKILLITFLTEIAGAFLIYSSLGPEIQGKLLFSVFHAVSGFCNAGFSTLQDGLYSEPVRNNYNVQIYVAMLVVLGGIGFPVLLGFYSKIKKLFIVMIRKLSRKRIPAEPEKKNVSAGIVIFMTVLLILTGTALYYLFESGKTLRGMPESQKLLVSFFGSVSARTAGFNVVNITRWSYPTIFLMMFLMWVGASPGSTGGGIKTTTFALAFRSAWSNIRGREHMVIGNREVGSPVISRVLSIIFLSMIVITTGFFCLLITDPDKDPVGLLFESFSAFGTVGLSITGTSTLSQTGKIIVMLMMFTGRVGPLTLLTGLMLSHNKRYSRFPGAEIIIN